MTLFKQLAFVVSMIIIAVLGAVMYINYTSAKQDMIDSLYQSTVNNISTLSSKIADAKGHEALTITTIDAEFDAGYYMLIEFTSNDGLFHYKQAAAYNYIKKSNVIAFQMTNANLNVLCSYELL